MARSKRVWYPGALYHVMSRGIRKSKIFQEHGDYLFFLKMLCRVKEKHPFRLHAVCLMTNHFHMALETEDTALWIIMRDLLSLYAGGFNSMHDCTGHLFEGRYTSKLIEDERYFLAVSRYIHLNPVKAQIVKTALDYEYSSYGLFVNKNLKASESSVHEIMSGLVDTSRVHELFLPNPQEQYRMFVEENRPDDEEEKQIQKDIKEEGA